jgi:replicative superfamily II helicase
MLFTELPLDKDLLEGIADAKFTSCMPVQERTFTETLEKRDVYVQSQTGSGKTAAFLITIFEHFRRNTFARNRAVIIVPTRELAVQIEKEAQVLGGRLPYRIGSFFGGVGYDEQLDLLEQDVEIIVGESSISETPRSSSSTKRTGSSTWVSSPICGRCSTRCRNVRSGSRCYSAQRSRRGYGSLRGST